MFGLIGKLLSPVMPYLLGGAVAGGLLLSGLLYYRNLQYDKLVSDSASKIERSATNVIELNKSVTVQKKAIADLITSIKSFDKRDKERSSELSILRKSLNDERLRNDRISKKWEKVAKGRPSLLAWYINRAVTKRVQFFTTATCRTDCNPDKSSDSGRKAPTKAGPNSGG